MKNKPVKRLIAAVLSAVMVLSCSYMTAFAAGDTGTVAGPEQTITVSSGTTNREDNFNDGWKFYLGNNSSASGANFDDSAWDDVNLPHDFSIIQGYTTSGEAESGFLPGGTGWYRKNFILTSAEADKTIVLSFDGVYSDAYVYVNGTYVGEHHYGYTAFAFDITDYVICDGTTENVVAVKAVNNIPTSRWYSGSGIYRDVTLIVTDPVHVAYNGTYVTTPNISSGDGTVRVAVELDNDSETNVEVTVKNTVYTSDGISASNTAEATGTIGANTSGTITASPVVSSPKLWSIDDPNLYFVRTEVYVNGTLTDSYDTEFGFRWFSFTDSGFYLNGKAVKLNGVCMHHDQGAAGSAAYYDAMYRQLSVMKDMGVNAIRTSHNPADEDFIDICNELGLLVMEEAFDCWTNSKNGNGNDFGKYFSTSLGSGNNLLGGSSSMTWAEYTIKSMVKRDRNDPSIIVWSLGNELDLSNNYPTITQNLIDWIKELDTSRTYTLGDNKWSTSRYTVAGQILQVLLDNGGIAGFNYANSASSLSNLNNAWGVLISTETSSAINSRGVYTITTGSDSAMHLSSYDNYAVSWGISAHDSIWNTLTNDFVSGEFVWTGWDYLGEPTPWNGTGTGSVSGSGAVPNSSYFGIVDTAGFEKDTYYLYRSQWNQDETTLHLVTAWDSDNMYTSSGKTPVVVYSNAPVVKLYRNGTLIGTATRTVNTTSAGHTYYTYSTTSNNSSVCTAVSASGSASLYATFNVTYEAGTISAIAYDESGREITSTSGNKAVTTPGTVTQLEVTQNKTVMDADGHSLAYIEVAVQDANGNLDTTATNTINFSLSGNGEIVGVDNGDQATTEKYQQSSVLTSSTSAHIAAYAGKALVIVKSTDTAGTITVNVTANGLTGGSATITTSAVGNGTTAEDLVSYTMVRDYSVLVGTVPTLNTTATGTLENGSSLNGTITWDEISSDIYRTAGDYTVAGSLKFTGYDSIPVIARLHVIADVIAMRNISTVTMAGTTPTLPGTVNGVLADGTVTGEFDVTWDSVSADDFAAEDNLVTVNGRATVIGESTLPVTCTVRVAEAVNTESVNVAPNVYSLTQDIDSAYQSDNLNAVNDGDTTFQDNTSTRWTNYTNRTRSDTATLTFTWSTAQLLSGVNLYYYDDGWCAALPSNVAFQYSLNGTDFTPITYISQTVQTASLGAEIAYTFDEVINPIAVRVILTQQGGTSGTYCVGLIEAEMMTYAGSVEVNSSAALSGISVDGMAVSGFEADTLTYEAAGSAVTATTDVNAGITILPIYTDGVVRILTISEDGSEAKTYEVTLTEGCAHENTTTINAKGATCTEEGYTGDVYCQDCETVIGYGESIPATGHSTVLQNDKAATCTEDGYSGDEVCTICGGTVETGTVLPAAGHRWNSGVVTKAATTEEEGIMTYTCTVCGETRTESIPKLAAIKQVPSVKLSASKNSGKIRMTGTVQDFENLDNYYTITGQGFVYMTKSALGARSLNVNTPGRTKVSIKSIASTGLYSYSMTPKSSSTTYVIRAYLTYTDSNGKTVYVYSDPIYTSYTGLK